MKEILTQRTRCIGSAANELNIVKSFSNGETQTGKVSAMKKNTEPLVCIGFLSCVLYIKKLYCKFFHFLSTQVGVDWFNKMNETEICKC